MSHPHAVDSGGPPLAPQSKILHVSPFTQTAILKTRRAGRERLRKLRFDDLHQALEWCLANGTDLLLTHTEDPARN